MEMHPGAEGGAAAIVIILVALLIGLVLFGVWIWSIIHCVKNPALDGNSRIIWLLVIIFLQIIGTIIYFIAAPKASAAAGSTGPPDTPA